MAHSAVRTVDGDCRCECRAIFSTVKELDEHLVRADQVYNETVAEVAEVIEDEMDRVARHNNESPPHDWIDVDEMAFRIADRLGGEYFMIRWGT